MPVWNYKIELSDIFHAENVDFPAKRDEIVRRLRDSDWYDKCFSFRLADTLESLEDSENVEDFDYYWNDLYDVADIDRAWISTF